MKCAIVSDIHANFQAWSAVLLDIRSQGIDRILCLGDIVGYGPDPARVLESVHANVDHFALGNHDAVICGKMDEGLFTDNARRVICWTREQLNTQAVSFLKTLPLSVSSRFFRATHGEFSDPASFNYIIDPVDAMASWDCVRDRLLFIGHTHQPAIFLLGESGVPRVVEPQDFEIEDEKRFLVNVGSVGQPRDRQARAVYCVLDTEDNSVYWRRIPFDIDAYRESLQRASLPEDSSPFLRFDPRSGHLPLRDTLTFSPPRTREQAVQNTAPVEELDLLKKSVARWKMYTTAGLASLVFLTGLFFFWSWKQANRKRVLSPVLLAEIPAAATRAGANLLTIPQQDVLPGNPVPGWQVQLGDRAAQTVSVNRQPGEQTIFVLESRSTDRQLSLHSPPIRVRPGMRFTAQALIKKSANFSGEIAVCLTRLETRSDGRKVRNRFLWKKPVWDKGDGWFMAKKTHQDGLPAEAESIRYEINGTFTGRVFVREPSLSLKE